jgi:exonuclease SbcD
MRILHTSDWHLGKNLAGFSRLPEHEAFLEEVVALAADVDLVLIAGDVFDTYNPPIEAEELFYDTMARMGDGGRTAVVVIAGNHDSPDRLSAPVPLSATHGVYILGRPGDTVGARTAQAGRVSVMEPQPSVLELLLPCGETAMVAAVPYPSESRLQTLLSPSTRDRDLQAAYEHHLAHVFRQLAGSFRPDTVNVLMSHLAIRSCMPSESERALVGGAYQISAEALPAEAQYVALGHLHRPQAVKDAPTLTRYCGAPLAFRMSEGDYERSHCIVDVHPGKPAEIELIPIRAGRPLVTWNVDSFSAVLRGVEDGQYEDAFIELRVHGDRYLNHAELATLHRLPRDFVRIRSVLPEASRPPSHRADRRTLPTSELFRAFYREQAEEEPEAALVDLFVELTDAALSAGTA